MQAYLAPKTKLVIADGAKFYNTEQMTDETVVDFTARLRKAVQFCDFDKLKTSATPTEEMVLAALIAGLSKVDQRKRILEHFQYIFGVAGCRADTASGTSQTLRERSSFGNT